MYNGLLITPEIPKKIEANHHFNKSFIPFLRKLLNPNEYTMHLDKPWGHYNCFPMSCERLE